LDRRAQALAITKLRPTVEYGSESTKFSAAVRCRLLSRKPTCGPPVETAALPEADIHCLGRSQGGSGRHAVSSSSMKKLTFGERCRLDGYTARTAGPSVEYSLRNGTRRPDRRSSLIKKVASLAIPYPARVASHKASAFVELKRPLTGTVRMCPSTLKRHSTGRPP